MSPTLAIALIARDRYSTARAAVASACTATLSDTTVVLADAGYPADELAAIGEVVAGAGLTLEVLDVGRFATTNHAWNEVLRATSAERILYLENDVVLAPNALQGLLDAVDGLGADVAVAAIYEADGRSVHFLPTVSRIERLAGAGQRVHLDRGRIADRHPGPDPYRVHVFERHAFVMRRASAAAVGDLDELMFCRTDLDMSLACRACDLTVVVVPEARACLQDTLAAVDRSFYDYRWDIHRVQRSNDRLICKWQLTGYKRTIDHAYSARRRLDDI